MFKGREREREKGEIFSLTILPFDVFEETDDDQSGQRDDGSAADDHVHFVLEAQMINHLIGSLAVTRQLAALDRPTAYVLRRTYNLPVQKPATAK